jgi:hypothetical protein
MGPDAAIYWGGTTFVAHARLDSSSEAQGSYLRSVLGTVKPLFNGDHVSTFAQLTTWIARRQLPIVHTVQQDLLRVHFPTRSNQSILRSEAVRPKHDMAIIIRRILIVSEKMFLSPHAFLSFVVDEWWIARSAIGVQRELSRHHSLPQTLPFEYPDHVLRTHADFAYTGSGVRHVHAR